MVPLCSAERSISMSIYIPQHIADDDFCTLFYCLLEKARSAITSLILSFDATSL